MLTIDINKQLGDLDLQVNAQIPMQGICAIFGRSGAGKTSLVNILGGLSTPDNGQLTLGDTHLYHQQQKINLAPERRRIGYVFQEARLFPHYSVRGNLNYGNKDKDQVHFDTVVKLLGLDELLSRYPATLSGGEKQRVAIGRALLTRPQMLLMDEPLAALDLPRKRELIPYLLQLAKTLNLPIIYVSHSLDEILQLADSMLVLDKGKVLVNGPLQAVWDSAEMRPWLPAKEQSSLLMATITELNQRYRMSKLSLADGTYLWINGMPLMIDSKLRVRIHANHVSLCLARPQDSSIRNILPTTIAEIIHSETSDNVQVKLAFGQEHIWANITPWACDDLALTVGQTVYAQIKGVSMTESELAQSF
ncbi:molybdenum ABC transporter ATP-binding protein ModC [Moritella sp. Urea-trap-13]|uniref:molybdenum ABC transporter ATP-binding protein ModC n=1 Tax=Moritella sp. Urea-trap-13 TaxID=2058327 RepID=UPI000C345A41|nr:molybdenum ABC transporter ATP-binding protein ModC [Moritella sp. Urea-trap-13]PKH08109.1 molybdenum ABC transporter ATP-binding protein [Moritella sp. Urea-trap-13]